MTDEKPQNTLTKRPEPPVATRWKKGQSGNPGGRPKKRALTQAYEALLDRSVPGDSRGRTYAEKIAEVVLRSAARGNIAAAREVADRVEGKAILAIEQKGTSETQVRYVVEVPPMETKEEWLARHAQDRRLAEEIERENRES